MYVGIVPRKYNNFFRIHFVMHCNPVYEVKNMLIDILPTKFRIHENGNQIINEGFRQSD